MTKKFLFNILIMISGIISLFLPTSSYAASSPWLINIAQPDVIQGSQLTSLESGVTYIYGLMVEIAGIIFILLLLFGGITYMASGGNEEQANKAKRWLLDAVIGLVIVAIAWAAGIWIENSLLNTGNSNPAGGSSQSTPSGTGSGSGASTQQSANVIDNSSTGITTVDQGTKVRAVSSSIGYETIADSNGKFSISNVAPGTYTVYFTLNGLEGSISKYISGNSSSNSSTTNSGSNANIDTSSSSHSAADDKWAEYTQ